MSTRQVSAAEFKAKCLRIIQEMGSDGRSVTITRRGRPVAVLSPPPVEGEAPPFLGMMRGTVLAYEAPLAPAASPSCSNCFALMDLGRSLSHVVSESRTGRFEMEKRYRVVLSLAEREELRLLVSRGKSAARKQTRARILLMCDESTGERRTDMEVAGALSAGRATVERVRRRCVEEGLESALNPRKQLRRRRKVLDGEAEARLVAIACGEPPEGRARWTLRLLADRLAELEVVESVGTETVRQTLKKTVSSRG